MIFSVEYIQIYFALRFHHQISKKSVEKNVPKKVQFRRYGIQNYDLMCEA